jgi:UDP:flavonoid glycosyltransferase YjiC (YdhE family)
MLGAIEELGLRAVLLEHTFDFMIDDPMFSNPRLYIGKHFPHSWLFPRVSLIVHQGGAGHSAASARSGTPTVVVPIFDEQDFNASTIVSAGVAVMLKIDDLNQESFKAAIQAGLKLADRARAVGEKIEREVQESGGLAVRGIMRWLG